MLQLMALVLLSLSVFQLVISSILTKAQLEGRSCVANQTMGVYKRLKQCPSLYQKWLQTTPAANVPEDGIWCCPNEATSNRKRSIREAPTPDSYVKAKEKCEEYSKLADALSIPPVAMIDEQSSLSSSERVESQPKEFPHTAAIGFTSGDGIFFVCSGSVVSARFVLTAAHCTYDTYFGISSTFWVRVGDLNLNSTNDANAPLIQVIERIRHPLYNTSIGYHDIALLKLENDIHFNEWVRPTCLPYSLPDHAAQKAVATRWGGVDWDSIDLSNVISKVTMKLVSQLECNDSYKDVLPSGVIADWQFCAGENRRDICKASGGPLVTVNNDHPRMCSLIGITSMGKDCDGATPVIYTRVYHYVPWIQSIVWPNS
ncbi:serine protease snk-like [Megachile rotundata]|uniref:serine protease snk-like n=1 Tax=Megachile rotundata TaxID=143995 RepID=UPI003FCFA6B9